MYYKIKYAFKEPDLFTNVQTIKIAMKNEIKMCFELVTALKRINPDLPGSSLSNAATRIAAKGC